MLANALRALGLTLLLTSATMAQAPGNRTYIGQDIYVASGQEVHNVTCLFCSVQVEGEVTGRATVLFGNLSVSGWVRHNATILGGNAVVDSQARIGGNTVVLGGNAVYETDESISGNAYVLGGHLSKTGGHVSSHKRVSLNPSVFYAMGLLAFFLLALLLSLSTRRRSVVGRVS